MGGLSFRHSSSGFFGQGCQKSLGNSEKDRFNRAEPFILSSLSPSLSENPRPMFSNIRNIEEKCSFFMAGLRSAEARGELFCLPFHGSFGIGSRIPENPKNFSEKTFPRIKATGFRGSAETCQLYFQAIYKSKIERILLNGLSRVAKPLKRLRVLIGM